MRVTAFVYFFVLAIATQGQGKIEWSENYKLSLADFQGAGTAVGSGNNYFVQTGVTVDFAYQMSSAEFMMTKNWNSKVSCVLTRSHAFVTAPDDGAAASFIAYSQFNFDLCELYARKLRKSIFEEKTAFSSAGMFQPLFDQNQKELGERRLKASNDTNMGLKKEDT